MLNIPKRISVSTYRLIAFEYENKESRQSNNRAVARFLFEPQSSEQNCFGLLGGPGECSQKIFKIKGLRLAKNVFREISARKTR